MFEEYNICPYTGLRSFTEEESIYFKGRDLHIQQATEMLEKNKFLMLTGASGDGKSSLVYAGIIPNARAGFLKSMYTNWAIADFRPERTPFKNLCKSIAKALRIQGSETVESELQHGFSALVDLYKSSELYIDKNSEDWLQATDEEKKRLMLKTGNLIILTDQFEEFFTNPENYVRGVPSNNSNLVVNLLLETAAIALKEGLPIYVVFTMRSDYIGQCAAFRGLPENIGFSQFFVPRLNRKELQEVIEEPAELSGNKISRRLVDRLIHDITEGIDQLPILQHALNQIWKAADDGKEEMDLIHYAMVGGMPVEELPNDNQDRYQRWFDDLPKSIREYYHSPRLQNVLDTHANKIFESARYYLKEKTGKVLSEEDAHLIIRTTFICLTKIDHSRAVRNRMTLGEIADIINREGITTELVGALINIFREPGNTFIHPFILEENQDQNLGPETVLDITHESLIRNWNLLKEWADEEFEKFTTFADFKQQVDRWHAHDRSWGFLLPIGSLTYFEQWYEQVKPNPYWVNRYNEQVTDTAKNIEESREIVKNSTDFLKLSARKHMISRAVVRLGPAKIAISLAAILILVLSSFAIYDNIRKTNSYVLNHIKDEARQIINGSFAKPIDKASYLVNIERLEPGSAIPILNGIDDDFIRLEAAVVLAMDITMNDVHLNHPLGKESILYADRLVSEIANSSIESKKKKAELLALLIELTDVADLSYHYSLDPDILEVTQNTAMLTANLVMEFISFPWAEMNIKEVNEGLELALNHHSFSGEQINEIIQMLSPLEDQDRVGMITSFYTSDKLLSVGMMQYRFSYNGLYQLLGQLYASRGDVNKVIMAGDSLRKYHSLYEDYTTDAYTMAGYFASYGHWKELGTFTELHAQKVELKPYQVYNQILNRAGQNFIASNNRFKYKYFTNDANLWVNPILENLPDSTIDRLYVDFLEVINTDASDPDERNFNLAIYYKQIGTALAKRKQDRLKSGWEEKVFELYDLSYKYYQLVSDNYLSENINISNASLKRKLLYVYPDYLQQFLPYEQRYIYIPFHTDSFVDWVLKRDHFYTIYSGIDELQQLTNWITFAGFGRVSVVMWFLAQNETRTSIFESLNEKLSTHPNRDGVNLNNLKLILAKRYFEQGQSEKGIDISSEINPSGLQDILSGFAQPIFQNLAEVYGYLTLHEQNELSWKMMQAFTDKRNQSRLYDMGAIRGFLEGNKELGSKYLDSARQVIISLTDPAGGHYTVHANAIMLENKPDAVNEARKYIRSLFSFQRLVLCYPLVIRALTHNERYYDAYTAMPIYADIEKMAVINNMLSGLTYYQGDPLWHNYDLSRNFSLHFVGVNF